MPEHLHEITIALDVREATLTWEARQQLMARLRHVASSARIRASIEAAGTTRPVVLRVGQKHALLNLLREWSRDRDDYEPMPLELYKLRNVLTEELRDSEA
jgi:hypothetical protein